VLISNGVELQPFLPSVFSHSKIPAAYPFTRVNPPSPFNIYYSWSDPADDQIFYDAIQTSAKYLQKIAAQEHPDVLGYPKYPHWAIYGTPVEEIYGPNLPKLRSIKRKYDPHNLMGLAGGWKF
jgi:hypothetical protein